jgi:hypothetical protein
MRVFAIIAGLGLVACGRETTQTRSVAITDPPPLLAGSGSHLRPPASCPIYAAGGGDVDTPEPPFPGTITALCTVDEGGGSYGLVLGDAPTAHLAIVPGGQEVGVYIGFDDAPAPAPTIDLGADPPGIEAWAAATNIDSQDCCADTHPDKRIPVDVVAFGEHGVLFSVGRYDGTPIQVAWVVNASFIGSYERFYVNGAPSGVGAPSVAASP